MNKTLLLFLVLLIPSVVFSQKKSAQAFSMDYEKFPKSVESYLERSNKSLSTTLSKGLEKTWVSGFYTDEEKKRLITEANKLVDIKARTFPDFSNYIQMMISYPESGMDKNQFSQWLGVLETYSENNSKKKKLTKLLGFSRYFFESKSLFRTQSKSVDWRVDSFHFEFDFTDKTVELDFRKVNITCLSKGSEIEVLNTTGKYDVLNNSWLGNGGKVTFERAGADAAKVWVDVFEYQVDMRHSTYTADSVVYHNKRFLKEPLMGVLSDKVLANQNQARMSYPRFQSYNVHIPIKNLVKEVDYIGGFAQQGAKIMGTGTDLEPAVLNFSREGKPFMKVSSKRFLMNINDVTDTSAVEEDSMVKKAKNNIISSKARVVIFMDGDSIFHPGLKLNFSTNNRTVNLIRVRGEMSETPYSNSFHKVEMRFELLSWKMGDPKINFTKLPGTSKENSYGLFESEGFLTKKNYEDLMGNSSWHPLARMKVCATEYDTNVLSLSEITGCLKIPVTGVEPMLLRYTVMGYLDYNQSIKEVTLYPKLFHQVNAYSEKEDYDVIRVYSNGKYLKTDNNASLNLLNFDLSIFGVSSVTLSSEHSVKVLPDNATIVMKRNRDFDFNGIISSGKVDFYGHGFNFKYDDFKLDMPILDSMQIWASTDEVDKYGKPLEARVRTVIEQLKGDLQIDHPQNKSGIKKLPEYPIFKSKDNSYAYYDKQSVFNKVYNRSEFYFELIPFEIDSLDKFKNDGISFAGTLYSAGIFPDIEENLTLQPDYSLGFIRQSPPGGYPLYGNKGTFENEVNLSDRGLRGNGYISYLTSTAESESFYFFPKEVQGLTKQVEIEEQMAGVEYPNVNADTTKLRWVPYQDEYFLSSIKGKSPIMMFGGNVKHSGRLKYTPESMTGRGVSAFEGAKLYSDSMLYTFYKIHADTSDFELGQKSLETLDFSSENVQADIDFKERKGQFISNTGASLTRFEKVMYQAYLDRFTWFMDEEELEISAAGGVVQEGANEVQVEGAEFISINPRQDSLRFFAKTARYSLSEFKLQAREVKYINVADAEIVPNKGEVTIFEDAMMQRLDSSTIIANAELRYHNIYDAHTTITGRWDYTSSGKYDYTDENGLDQIIEFTDIGVDSTKQTTADGIILEDDDFSLSPMYRYRGKVNLFASRKNLTFDGYGKLVHDCENIPASWFQFGGEVDPYEIVIPIKEEILNKDGGNLYASLIMPRDSNLMYGGFINQKRHYRDVPVSLATGYLEFDPSGRQYRISNLQKLNESSYPGNYVAIDINKCTLDGEGQLDLTQETGRLEVQAVGNYDYNSINNKANFRTSMTIDFLFDDGLLNLIVEDAKKAELDPTDDNPNYELTLRELMDKKAADEMISKIGLSKNVKIPMELRKTIFFSKLDLKWVEETTSYISVGKLGIGNMGKTPVNMLFDGGVEFVQKRGETDITIYLEISSSKWYIFNYRSRTGIMQVYSSNKEFMTKMMEIKTDKKKIKREGEIRQYQYMPGSKRNRSKFLLQLEDTK